MEINQAIELLKKIVKHTGTIDQMHIDLTLAPAAEREKYTNALHIAQEAVKKGELTRDLLFKKLGLT